MNSVYDQFGINTRSEFDDWCAEMDSEISALKDSLPASVAAALDFTLDSLDVLERYLLDTYSASDEIVEQRDNFVRFGRYIGEVLRLHANMHWDIDLDNDNNIDFKSPVLVGKGIAGKCPFPMATASVHRQTGNYIRTCARKFRSTTMGG